jgi:hypothetical protein
VFVERYPHFEKLDGHGPRKLQVVMDVNEKYKEEEEEERKEQQDPAGVDE